jgi:hypothetical protein
VTSVGSATATDNCNEAPWTFWRRPVLLQHQTSIEAIPVRGKFGICRVINCRKAASAASPFISQSRTSLNTVGTALSCQKANQQAYSKQTGVLRSHQSLGFVVTTSSKVSDAILIGAQTYCEG